ncbi:OmpH family outer membrane protein [Brevundimonas sp.]|uniref:OmpH family outer membrane protein n=1 Tax=Brevundimonas sp. TaxID=1871086 RepID=UPI002D6EE7FF|nr:OmpH family outer membrane protein [Brevundimonas sp.]HYC75701.1 OmpH family outer membrane protein [Brevundimonas sp.]
MKTLAFGAFALATLAGSAAAAQDQNFGPVVPGVCIYHHDRLMAQSTAGQSLVAGLQRLQQEVTAELGPYEQYIQTEGQALQQGQASIPQDQLQQRAQALETRYREFETLRQTRTGELRYTLAYQQQQIGQAVDPILGTLYAERGCGILLSADAVMRANPQMDLTEMAIQRLNAALPTLPAFSRMAVPAQPAQ